MGVSMTALFSALAEGAAVEGAGAAVIAEGGATVAATGVAETTLAAAATDGLVTAGGGALAAGSVAPAAVGAGAFGSLGTSLLTAAGSQVVSSLLAPSQNGLVPTLKAPTAMPDADAIAQSKKRAILSQVANRGRLSTILTDSTDKLGG